MWKQFVPGMMVHNSLNKEKLAELLDFQETLGETTGRRRRVAIVWDDVMYMKNALKGDSIRNLFFNGRHLDVWFINSAQYLMDLEPALRLQVDYIFTFADPVPDNRAKLRKYYVGHVPAVTFEQCMRVATVDFKCLVVDQIESKLFWYKAPAETEEFRMCEIDGAPFWRIAAKFAQRRQYIGDRADKTDSVNLYDE
tara:strand:- start:60 stop:647 length:588 start_codon:yes stop_codon:yes gene_type:complete